ncbi:MAG: hypothetical protein V8R01_00640 [Bacilli bacterium]
MEYQYKDATTGLTSLNMSTSNVTLYAIYRKEAVTLTAKFNGNELLYHQQII